jgi:hypothetical protein
MIEDQYVVIFGQRQMILEGERAMRIRCLRIHSPNLYNLLIYIGNIAKYGGERVRITRLLYFTLKYSNNRYIYLIS